jgi:hypothetical protein
MPPYVALPFEKWRGFMDTRIGLDFTLQSGMERAKWGTPFLRRWQGLSPAV